MAGEEVEHIPYALCLMQDKIPNSVVLEQAGILACICCLVVKSCPTLCDHMDHSTQGPPVFHCLPELGQIHIGRFDD